MKDAQNVLMYADPITTTEQACGPSPVKKRGSEVNEQPEAKRARITSAVVDVETIKDVSASSSNRPVDPKSVEMC